MKKFPGQGVPDSDSNYCEDYINDKIDSFLIEEGIDSELRINFLRFLNAIKEKILDAISSAKESLLNNPTIKDLSHENRVRLLSSLDHTFENYIDEVLNHYFIDLKENRIDPNNLNIPIVINIVLYDYNDLDNIYSKDEILENKNERNLKSVVKTITDGIEYDIYIAFTTEFQIRTGRLFSKLQHGPLSQRYLPFEAAFIINEDDRESPNITYEDLKRTYKIYEMNLDTIDEDISFMISSGMIVEEESEEGEKKTVKYVLSDAVKNNKN